MASGRLAPDVYLQFLPSSLGDPQERKEKTIVKPWSVVQGWVGRLLLLNVFSDLGPADASAWKMAGRPVPAQAPCVSGP